MKKLILLMMLGCVPSYTALANDHTNTADKIKVLETSFVNALDGLEPRTGQTNRTEAARLREQVGLFVGTLCDYPPDADGSLVESDTNISEFTYSAYVSDLRYLQRTRKGDETLSMKVLAHRVNSLVSAYPLASRPNKGEHMDMTIFLAYASQTNSNDVRSAVKSKLDRLGSADQLPFLVALSGLGDKEVTESLDKNASPESHRLQSLFKRLYEGIGASK